METKITEISGGIYRLSTFVPQIAPPAGFTFNQFLVLGDDPLLFHTGLRQMFPLIHSAISRLIPPERLRWITFGHYEADECGAMNEWLAVAPQAEVAHGQTSCLVSLNDMATARLASFKMVRLLISAKGSASVTLTRRISPTAGMREFFTKR
jgi:flavorubredoxin